MKRKYNDNNLLYISNNKYDNFDIKYFNELDNSYIKIYKGMHNSILFNGIISITIINKLIHVIKEIVTNYNYNSVYLHIYSKGGYISALNWFIEFKDTYYNKVEFISIIEEDSFNAGFLLASLCDYRIIRKNVICYMTPFTTYNNYLYWGAYKQKLNDFDELKKILLKIKYKVSNEKMLKYLQINNIWDSKKMHKIGLIDEIIQK